MRPIDKHEATQWNEAGQKQAEDYLREVIADHVIRTGLDGTNLAEELRRQSYVWAAAAGWLMELARRCDGG